jgi:sialate O-acetylesterase
VRLLLLLGALAFMLPLPARSSVRLPEVLGDHMVLQQNTEVTFWGWASVGRTVQVETSWGEKAVTHAQPDGSWQVKIKTPAAQPLAQGLRPEHITFTMPEENVLQIRDVLIGEVWLCSGQSNMEMMLRPGYSELLIRSHH